MSETEIRREPVSPASEGNSNDERNTHVQQSADPSSKDLLQPIFSNLVDDYHLLDNLNRYSRYCEHYNVAVPQMAQGLARAIGVSNGGKYGVLIYDYLNAIPEYPPTLNGRRAALIGDGYFCNLICYKTQLFGVVVFPASEHVTFYFPEFTSYAPYVQRLIFTYGNKTLRLCSLARALAFDFKPTNLGQLLEPAQSILLTATLKRKLAEVHHEINNQNGATDAKRKCPGEVDYIQLD